MKINLKIIYYIFLIIPFIKPYYFTTLTSINTIYNLWQMFSALIIVVIYIRKEQKISKFNIYVMLMEVVLIISSLINNADITSAILNAVQTIAFCFLIDYGIKSDCRKFIKSLLFVLEVLVLANIFTIIFLDGKLTMNGLKISLFGRKNGHFSVIFAMLICSITYSYINGDKLLLRTKIMLIISTISIALVNSSTGIIGMALIWVYVLFKEIIRRSKLATMKNYIIIYIILFFGIIIFRIQNIFSFIIVDMLNKDLTFTGRTNIWDTAINLIKRKFLIGYGCQTQEMRTYMFNNYEAVHAHNMILDLLYQGGIVLFTLFSALLINIENKVRKFENTQLGCFFAWSLLIYLIVWLTEVYAFEKFLWIFLIFYNIEILINVKNRNVEEK